MNAKQFNRIIFEISNCKYKKITKSIIKNELSFRNQITVHEYYTLLNNDIYFICPTCKHTIEREYVKYCICCGQYLSWRGTMKNAKHVDR